MIAQDHGIFTVQRIHISCELHKHEITVECYSALIGRCEKARLTFFFVSLREF